MINKYGPLALVTTVMNMSALCFVLMLSVLWILKGSHSEDEK